MRCFFWFILVRYKSSVLKKWSTASQLWSFPSSHSHQIGISLEDRKATDTLLCKTQQRSVEQAYSRLLVWTLQAALRLCQGGRWWTKSSADLPPLLSPLKSYGPRSRAQSRSPGHGACHNQHLLWSTGPGACQVLLPFWFTARLRFRPQSLAFSALCP